MSGGHFDYKDASLHCFVEQIDEDLSNEDYFKDSPKEMIEIIKDIREMTNKTGMLLHLYDYMISGDISYEKFINDSSDILGIQLLSNISE